MISIRKFVQIAFIFFALNAQAAFELPDLSTREKQMAFSAQLEVQAPWLKGQSNQIVPGSINLIPRLLADPTWQKLAAERGEPAELVIDVVQPVEKEIRQVRADVLQRWQRELDQVGRLETAELKEKLSQELGWLATHDAKALATGLINSLPKEKRGEVFKINSTQDQLKALRASRDLTDAAVRENFRAADFGMDQKTISKKVLLNTLEESLQREATLATHLRSVHMDFFNLEPTEQKRLLDGLITIAPNDKRTQGVLQKLLKANFHEEDYEVARGMVDSVVKTYRVVEVDAAIGATRGWLMADCNTGAYGFSYSPAEYIYLVYDQVNEPVAFVGATLVMSGDKRVLYIHDFGGRMQWDVPPIVGHGFFLALKELGFDEMTVTTKNGNNSGEWIRGLTGETIAQTYLDGTLKDVIYTAIGYPHNYDRASSNAQAQVFRPSQDHLKTTRVRVIKKGVAAEMNVKSKPASIQQALAIFNANPDAGVSREMLQIDGVRAADIFSLFNELKNEQKLPLEEYYRRAGEMFEKFEIKFSKNFARENAHLFRQGHMNAIDAATVQDSALFNRTVNYITEALKSQRGTGDAIRVLRSNLPGFMANDRFQAYLRSFTGRGPAEDKQISQLMEIGLRFDHLKKDAGVIQRLAASESVEMRYWALDNLSTKDLQGLPPEAVRQIAKDLDMDHDDYPRIASKILMHVRSDDPEVKKELEDTVAEEEEMDIVLRAMIALHLNGAPDPEGIATAYRDAGGAKALDKETAALAQQLKGNAKPRSAEDCNAALEGRRPLNPRDVVHRPARGR